MEQAGNDSAVQWSEEDLAWLQQIPEGLQPTARRHGRELFQIVMQAGTATHGLGILSSMLRGNRKGAQALEILSLVLNDLCRRSLEGKGLTMLGFAECKRDIELVAVLTAGSAVEGERRSSGGILLDS